jgi:molybdopterin-guanine dinucleotide biosynthesis protein A
MKVVGVIQAGGRSTRMGGQPKALLEVGGHRIIERVIAALVPVLGDPLIVTNSPELYGFLGLPMVGDVRPDHGSLGGIYSGLAAVAGDAAFTVACDMPFLHPDLVRLVVERAASGDVVVPRVADQFETMHACYARRCLPAIEDELAVGRLKIVGFFSRVQVVEIPESAVRAIRDPALAFMNVNTPDELDRARDLARDLG